MMMTVLRSLINSPAAGCFGEYAAAMSASWFITVLLKVPDEDGRSLRGERPCVLRRHFFSASALRRNGMGRVADINIFALQLVALQQGNEVRPELRALL